MQLHNKPTQLDGSKVWSRQYRGIKDAVGKGRRRCVRIIKLQHIDEGELGNVKVELGSNC